MPTVNVPISKDNYLASNAATTNYDNANLYIGESNAATAIMRAWIKPDFSSIPAGATFTAAYLHLTPVLDRSSNARTMRAHRCLRDVVSNQATWNIWKTSNNWGTAGCSNNSTDYHGAVELGNMAVSATQTLYTEMPMTLAHAEFQKLYDGTYTNNGIILFMDTQSDDAYLFGSIENTTEAYRPHFSVTYTLPETFIPHTYIL